jgi:hypothetical protein
MRCSTGGAASFLLYALVVYDEKKGKHNIEQEEIGGVHVAGGDAAGGDVDEGVSDGEGEIAIHAPTLKIATGKPEDGVTQHP